MTPLSKSPYSYHFTMLFLLGAWLYETDDQTKVNKYVVYKVILNVFALYGVYCLSLDLYLSLGDMKKMTWNLCVTLILTGTLIKNFQTLKKSRTVNWLRMCLHTSAESRASPEDVSINNSALKELKLLRMCFYGTGVIFIPTWIISRYWGYVYGTRELPIPLKLPEIIDLDSDFMFNLAFALVGTSGIFGMVLTMETELAMFALLIQISREYDVLVKNIPQLNEMYVDDSDSHSTEAKQKEVNPHLKKVKIRKLIRKFSIRQMELIQYTQAFEDCYNKSLLQEFFSISVLIVSLCLQCLWESVDFSGTLLYQIGYLFINVADMFLICLFSTRLKTQCQKVGETVYATFWYKMEIEAQKKIGMMILRSQHPPKITVGKFMELSFNAFMNIMSHLYSWLALFRQLETSL